MNDHYRVLLGFSLFLSNSNRVFTRFSSATITASIFDEHYRVFTEFFLGGFACFRNVATCRTRRGTESVDAIGGFLRALRLFPLCVCVCVCGFLFGKFRWAPQLLLVFGAASASFGSLGFCVLSRPSPISWLDVPSFTGFYWVTEFFFSTEFHRQVPRFSRPLLDFIRFDSMALGITGFYWVSLGRDRFFLGLNGFEWVLLGFTGS